MKIIAKAHKIFREKILRKPTQVVLEPTNRCNLNCPYCMVGMHNEFVSAYGTASHSLMTRPQGAMSEDVFQVVLRNIIAFGIKKVYLHFQGEPFLNTHTPAYARQLKEKGLTVGVFTNGQAFNDHIIDRLADAEIDLIRFSVDGASEESYQRNRVGGRFCRVYENMEKVALACKGKGTRIEWQFLALRNNEHEIETAREMAEEIGVHFFVKGFRETDDSLAPVDARYRARFQKKPCTDIYLQLGIYWNGDVVPCCYDVDGKEIMGNIADASFQEIWESEKYCRFRKNVADVLTCPECEPVLCKTCLKWVFPPSNGGGEKD